MIVSPGSTLISGACVSLSTVMPADVLVEVDFGVAVDVGVSGAAVPAACGISGAVAALL